MKRKYKIILTLIFMLGAVFAFCIGANANDIWDGTVSKDAPLQNGLGYYQINNARELAWISKQVNSGYNNIKIRLMEDIYLNDVDNNQYINEWTPIGSDELQFEGEFDGNNHIIYGLYINNQENYQGLFGFLSNAKVKGLKLYNVKINALQYIGGITGFANDSTTINNCIVSGEINASNGDCGGISGYSKVFSTISNCGYKGVITSGGNRTGGITGCMASNAVVSKCFNYADITSTGKFVGGIAGTSSGSKVLSSFNTGNISGAKRVGGIVGNNVADINASYNSGVITGDSEIGAISGFNSVAEVSYCYYLENTCDAGDEFGIPKNINDIKRYSFILSLNKNGGDFTNDYQEENGGLPVLTWQLECDIWTRGVKKPSLYLDGKSYMITSGEELAWFAGLVNGTLEGVAQNQYANAVLMKSIVLNMGEYVEGLTNDWTPIGTGEAEYFGTFEGNGKTISGIYISGGENVGLFGSVRGDATVKNLYINDANITGKNAGALAGSNLGTVSNVKVTYSKINAAENGGGVMGENEGNLTECYFANGEVHAGSFCGGICGKNNEGIISSCYSLSNVSSLSYVGGISGQNTGTITKCFNGGDISSTNNYAGGICGSSSYGTINNCYNTGEISGISYVGGIVGFARYGEVSVCFDVGEVKGSSIYGALIGSFINTSMTKLYYDSERISATDSNATGLNTSKMTGSTAISSLSGFSRTDWTTRADTAYHVYYPQLSVFSQSGEFDFNDNSLESVKFLKYDLHCRVDINEVDTYYPNIKQAAEFIGTKTANIYVFDDITVNEKTQINGNITVRAENGDKTVYRADTFDDSFFDVKGTLNLGDEKDDFVVTYSGSELENPSQSIVYVSMGTLNAVKCLLCDNFSVEGGAVTNCANANLYNCEITNCKAISAGGAIYNKSKLIVDGADIHSNISFENGGAIYNDSLSEESQIVSGNIYLNTSSSGGAVYSKKGTFSIAGGEIFENSATYGGAVYVNGGIVADLGGIVRNNSAEVGNAVYNNAKFVMGDNGYIDNTNDIYLPTGKTVTMLSKIDSSSVCLNITPEKYEKNIRVVDGAYAASNYRRVFINDYQTQNWHINSSGYLLTDEVVEVALVSILGAHSVYYTSLEEAFTEIGSNDAIITIVDDITVKQTLNVVSNVTILSDGQIRSVTPSKDLTTPVFDIKDGCSLVLGDNVNEETNDILYFDSDSHSTSSYFVVEQGGLLKIYNGVVLNNMVSDTYSSVENNGTVEIYGGKFIDNNAKFGAINNCKGASLDIYSCTFDNENVSINNSGIFTVHNSFACANQAVRLDNSVINIADDYIGTDIIALIKFDKYVLKTVCVETSLDKTLFKDKFVIFDECYYLDDELKLDADKLSLKQISSILYNSESNYIYNIQADVNTAENIMSQFENTNTVVYDINGNEVPLTAHCGTKYKICLVDSNNDVYDFRYILIYGDVNSDGYADGEDSVLINMIFYNYLTLTDPLLLEACDVNHDEEVDLSDAWIVEDAGVYNSIISQKKDF